MHSLFEDYLSKVAAHLGSMPVKKRNEELREMQTHLENAFIVSRELGQTEDEAAQSIITQFGMPRHLGENVVWAWRRDTKLSLQSCLKVASYTVAMTILLVRLMPLLHFYPLPVVMKPHFSLLLWSEWILWQIPVFLLAGGVSGFLFPKRSVEGVLLGMDAVLFYFLMTGGMVAAGEVGKPDNFYTLQIGVSNMITLTVISVAAAWISSRLRLAWGKWGRQARV